MLVKIIRSLLLAGLLATAALLIFTLMRGQEGLIKLISPSIHGKHAVEKLQALLTPGRMRLLQVALGLAMAVMILLYRYAAPMATLLTGLYIDTVALLKDSWKTAAGGPGKWLILLPLSVTLYGMVFIPINFDEALTYFDFTSRGPMVSLTYYPYPNNHVLHSLITNFTRYLPFHALVNLRMMPWLITLLTNFICLHLMTRLYGSRTAWVITAISSVIFFSLYYGYMSRGYYLVSFWFLICFYSAERICRGDAHERHRTAFTIAAIFGFFTVPSFLYPFVTLCLYMVLRRRSSFLTVFRMGIMIVPAVVLLYLPIILVSGLSALTNNPYVKPIGRMEVWRELPTFLGATVSEMTGFHWIWILAVLLIGAIHAMIFRQRSHLRDMAFFLAMPMIILLGHSVIPFPRTFNYYVILLCIVALLPYGRYFERMNTKGLLFALLAIQALFCWRFFQVIRPYEERDPQVNMTAWDINRQILGDKKFFCAGALMGTNLRFEMESRLGYKDRVTYQDAPVNADTLNGFDNIIVGRLLDRTVSRKPVYASPYFTVYDGHPLADTSLHKP